MTNYLKKTLFLGVLAGLLTVLVARLIDVQVIHGQKFVQLADDNRLFSLAVTPTRGVFLDRYGDPLIWNTRTYYKKLQPFSLYSETLPIEQEEGLQLVATAGGEVERKVARQYRYGSALAHTLGYVGPVTAEDVAKDETLLPSQTIGKMGLEFTFNPELRGIVGSEVWEINARVSRQRRVSEVPAQPGKTIETSLDHYLAQVAASAMGTKRGSVVVADAATGKILTLVNSPSFDPNLFANVPLDEAANKQRQETIKALFADPHKPFFNRAVSGAYPPGSIFKLVTALAGLEENAITSSTTVLDEGVLRVGEYEYGNWYYRQYGRTDGQVGLVRALAHSNDIFFYKAAEWIGVNQLATMAQLFGLGRATGIELSPESAGLVPTPAWKEQVIGEPWYLGNTYHMGIGQGDLLVTPVQIAQLVQTIANQGEQCRLSLLQTTDPDCRSLSLQPVNIDLVLEGMLDACSPDGTAFPFFERNRQIRATAGSQAESLAAGAVACKTGTAEFGGANEQGYRKTHGWWVGVVEPQVILPAKASDTSNNPTADLNEVATGSSTASQSAELETSSASATDSARLITTDQQQLRQQWLNSVDATRFPKRLVVVVLVESDDEVPFREGSRDASPVGKVLLDWIEGR
jgi:penicillin-binding protein 2